MEAICGKEEWMAATTNGPATKVRVTSSPGYAVEDSFKGTGWVLFAGIMFMISAVLNVIWGIAAVANSGFFVNGAHYILLTNLSAWGWIALGFGALELLAAFSIWRGGAFGRWFGMIVAGLGIVLALMSMPAYPLWSLAIGALEALVIYGLAVYGGRPELGA
jgi:hypothetical protein